MSRVISSRWMLLERTLSERIIITKAPLKEGWGQEFFLAAAFDEKRMTQIQVEAVSKSSILGNIYIGRVENIATNIQAAFVNIAKGVSCFLPLEEAKNAVFTKKNGKKDLCIGDELLVEVTREKQKNKPASVSANLNFSGKYLILTTGNHLLGISKKLHATERERLQALLKDQITDTFGIVVRTAAKDASDEEILKELEMLTKQCHACLQGAMHRTAFTRLREAPPFYLQFLKNRNLTEVQKITTDISSVHEVLLQHLQDTKDAEKLHLYTDTQVSLFALYSLTHELERALHRQVWLPSGAYLVIDPTEALTVIDVNSGKNIKKKAREELVFSVNVEAAHEIARQLILRNISGICIIDFIDMKEKEHREELMHILRMDLKKDKVPATLVDITRLGLVELTRKKVQKSLKEQLQGDVSDEK
ncbi:MAG TPA: ribonuclease E/G [Lachnospiraceae bacterium]|nr:ribonuclease E/G [Lachnospiraceae bacterium]